MNTKILAAVPVAMVLCAMSFAATAESERPEEIVVTAASLGDVLQPSKVLRGNELTLKSAPTLGETLSNELGISSTYFGPAASRPVIRGLSGSRVKMLSDSSSTLDVSDVSPDHAVAVEPLLADQIEIIRGPATLLYGSAAAGGVINVSDSRIPEGPIDGIGGAVEVRGDTAAEERAVVGRLDGGSGAFAWHLDGFDRQTENLRIAEFATADPAERPADERKGELANSYGNSKGGSVGLSWVGESGYLGASVSQLNQTYGLPGPELEEAPGGEPDLFEGPFLDMEQTRVDLRGEYRFSDGYWESLRGTVGVNDYTHIEVEPSGEVATEFRNEAWQARLEAVHVPIAGWRGAVGIQVDDRDLSAVGEEAFVTPTKTDAAALFLLEERNFAFGHVHLGARAESLQHRNDLLADYDNTAWSFGGGVGVDMMAASELFVNLSYTQRNLAAEELYSDGAHIATRQYEIGLLAAPGGSVRLENSSNFELGWRREQGDTRWETSVYYYDIADYVYQNLTGALIDDLPVVQYTQQDANFYGAEAAVTVPLLQTDAFLTELRLFGDFVRAELSSGEKLPRIPPWRTGANFKLGQNAWQTGLDVVYHAKQDDVSSFNTDAYVMVDLNLLYSFELSDFDWEFFARGTNLLNEDARKSASFLAAYAPLPGRSLMLGARLRF